MAPGPNVIKLFCQLFTKIRKLRTTKCFITLAPGLSIKIWTYGRYHKTLQICHGQKIGILHSKIVFFVIVSHFHWLGQTR